MQTFKKIHRVFAFIMFILSIIAWVYFIYESMLLEMWIANIFTWIGAILIYLSDE